MVAVLSTIAVFVAIGVVVVNAPGWPIVQRSFFNAESFIDALPKVGASFLVNVRIFLIAEALILVLALGLAVVRSLPGPAFFPLRAMVIGYIDVVRGLPSIMVMYLFGFGIPALQLPGVTNDPLFWGLVALVLLWSPYVAEVYRAGIESVHPSQEAAARSLGLSRLQAVRFVVLPQAVRKVVPPLLNDFIGLQKDSALLSVIGIVESFRRSQILTGEQFEFAPFLATAVFFLALTIPLARAVDWLAARDRRRQFAGNRAR